MANTFDGFLSFTSQRFKGEFLGELKGQLKTFSSWVKNQLLKYFKNVLWYFRNGQIQI